MFGIVWCSSDVFAFYIPVAPTLKGVGNANVQVIDADFRSMEQAALLFRLEDPSEANNLSLGVNHIGILAQYSDAPGRFADSSNYGFLVDARGWWIGIKVSGSESTREYVKQAAGSHGWLGSPDTLIIPGSAVFGEGDSVVWKFLR